MDPLEQWKGEFGDEYTRRNRFGPSINQRQKMMAAVLQSAELRSNATVLEVGANIGWNLAALRRACPDFDLTAVEPNDEAYNQIPSFCRKYNHDAGYMHSFQGEIFDLVFTCGVLIHIDPDELLNVCDQIYCISKKYIACIEYFRPTPESIEYHGQTDLLWARDFGEFWQENFEVRHIAHGFFWKPATGLDNLTWWLFEK